MNILVPDSWLKEYLDTDATVSEIKKYLSLCGPSVERIVNIKGDSVYDIEITSNRADMASVYGISREAAAILPRFGKKALLKLPKLSKFSNLPNTQTLPLTIKDTDKLCNRILAAVLTDVNLISSPSTVKNRLEKSGIRSLNNVIDITNYIMLELGQPCHVFDYDRIKTAKLIFRRAKNGESLVTLENKKYALRSEDVIIDDGTGRIIDLPGIIGTKNSVVTPNTKRIVLLIESNKPQDIRRTSMRLGIRTQAATINEKFPDPENAKTAMLKAIEYTQKNAGGKIAGDLIDIYPKLPGPKKIELSVRLINKILGIKISNKEIKNILRSLGFIVVNNKDNENLIVTPPSFRNSDIAIEEDLVEEVARIYGYHNLPCNLMKGDIPIYPKQKSFPVENKIKSILKYWGYREVYHYSFSSRDLLKKSQFAISNHLKIANPLTSETSYMRTSLIPSMLDTVYKNQNKTDKLSLFELAKVYIPQEKSLPDEISMLTITNQESFYHLKGVIEKLLEDLGISQYTYSKKKISFFHPKQSVSIVKDNLTLATVGLVHPQISQSFAISKNLFVADIDVDKLTDFYSVSKKYSPIPSFPPIKQDFSFDVPQVTELGKVIKLIYSQSNLITNADLIDSFHNVRTIRITFQHPERNLTKREIREIKEKIVTTVEEKLGATVKT